MATKTTGVRTYEKKLVAATYRLCASTVAASAGNAATSILKTVTIK